MSFALLLAKNVHLSIGEEFCALPCQKFAPQFFPSWMALSSHFPLPKTLHFSKQFAFLALSHGVIDRRSKHQGKRSNFRLHRSSLSSKKSKKWIKLIPKTIGNRKRDCAWGCAGGINTTWENLQIEKHKSGRRTSAHRTDLCSSICRFSQVVFIPQAQPHAQSLFLFPIVFGINHTSACSSSQLTSYTERFLQEVSPDEAPASSVTDRLHIVTILAVC